MKLILCLILTIGASAFAASDVNYKCTVDENSRSHTPYYLKINKGSFWTKGFFAYSLRDPDFSNERNMFELGDGYETAGYLCFENGVADLTFRVTRNHTCFPKSEVFSGRSQVNLITVRGGYKKTDLTSKAAHYESRQTIPCNRID